MDSSSESSSKISNNEFNVTQIPAKTTKHDLKKYFKLRLILGILKTFCEEGGDVGSGDKACNERVIKLTKTFIAKNFLQNIGIPDYIQTTQDIHLSYSEEQLIHRYLTYQINKAFIDSIDVIRTIKAKNPEFLNLQIIPEKEMIDLELNRQQLYKDLVFLKQKKHKLLLNLIDVRLSPKIEYEMRILLKEFEILDLKADVFYAYINHHVMKQTTYASKALAKIEVIIDNKLKEKEQG